MTLFLPVSNASIRVWDSARLQFKPAPHEDWEEMSLDPSDFFYLAGTSRRTGWRWARYLLIVGVLPTPDAEVIITFPGWFRRERKVRPIRLNERFWFLEMESARRDAAITVDGLVIRS